MGLIPGAESFRPDLDSFLPADLPNRDSVIAGCAQHLAMIAEANLQFNLTRITSPLEAAVKHVFDSVAPWRLFEKARNVLDAGTGAGFPGIPLALVLPGTSFTLAESIQKKARFVQSAAASLGLPNVRVEPHRAEELWRTGEFDFITMRAVAPVERVLDIAEPALKRGSKLLLYKGPDAGQEIEAARRARRSQPVSMRIVMTYDLPASAGVRNVVEVTR